jgi:HPt (histidine-containing phosphotransfer) domain-containing protein
MSPADFEELSSVIDSKALLSRCLQNLDFASKILTMFEDRCEVELNELDEALVRGDIEVVRRIAHRLTGTCANAAAVQMQSCCAKLKQAADENSLPKTSECLQDLRKEWQRLSDVLSPHRPTVVSGRS